MVVISEAAFGNPRDFHSQLGYITVLVDKYGIFKVIHYASNWFKRVTSSVLSAELYALLITFDHACFIRDFTKEMLGRIVPIDAKFDSKTFFDVVVKDRGTSEKRLKLT